MMLDFIARNTKKIKNFLLIGALAVLIDYFLYSTLMHLHFSISFSKAIGFLFGTFFSFLGNRNITFKSRYSKLVIFKYFILYSFTMNLNIFLNIIFIDFFSSLKLVKQLSFFIATGSCAVLNFIALNFLVFVKGVKMKKS